MMLSASVVLPEPPPLHTRHCVAVMMTTPFGVDLVFRSTVARKDEVQDSVARGSLSPSDESIVLEISSKFCSAFVDAVNKHDARDNWRRCISVLEGSGMSNVMEEPARYCLDVLEEMRLAAAKDRTRVPRDAAKAPLGSNSTVALSHGATPSSHGAALSMRGATRHQQRGTPRVPERCWHDDLTLWACALVLTLTFLMRAATMPTVVRSPAAPAQAPLAVRITDSPIHNAGKGDGTVQKQPVPLIPAVPAVSRPDLDVTKIYSI